MVLPHAAAVGAASANFAPTNHTSNNGDRGADIS